jgi:hypothetical protein
MKVAIAVGDRTGYGQALCEMACPAAASGHG